MCRERSAVTECITPHYTMIDFSLPEKPFAMVTAPLVVMKVDSLL